MNIKTLTTLSATFLLSAILAPSVSAHNGDYLTDSLGNAVKDSSGKCVKAVLGNMVDGCGTPAPQPEPVAVAAPAPAPVFAPAPPPRPKPIVRPAPAPKVHVLNLNESGGSNFATNSAKLSSKAQHQLTAFANKVKASRVSPSSVTIIGHTDSRGSKAHNQALSVRRAQSVASFLSSKGISHGVMHIGGRGETQPAASNKTKTGRAANRRVSITVKGQRRITR